MADLARLYNVASGYAPLRARATAELLPRLNVLAARLRALVRRAQLSEDAIHRVAVEILALGSEWRSELENLRTSAAYQEALAAVLDDRQEALTHLIPQVVADAQPVYPAPSLYFPVAPAAERRRPGSSPFLSAAECAERIRGLITDGIVPVANGNDWWDRELVAIPCTRECEALEAPIALRVDAAVVRVAVFTAEDDAALRVYTTRLRAPMSVTLAADATDEWWDAYDESYRSFRDALRRELAARGQAVVIEALWGQG